MAGSTPRIGLIYFDFGESLDSAINIKYEIDRFLTLDRQLYGLYRIFGDGVIEGWGISNGGFSEDTGISISVGTGLGIINNVACETSITTDLSFLPLNSTPYVYANLVGDSTTLRDVAFSVVESEQTTGVLLATVVTGEDGISEIDNTVKTKIGFEEVIDEDIADHRHRGSPSKIDLETETKNELPPERIEGVEATKVVGGRIARKITPTFDHNEFENRGSLSHAQIDTLLDELETDVTDIFGAKIATNHLKHMIFLKGIYSSSDTYLQNEIIYVPGVSPSDFADTTNTTATIDTYNRCIYGSATNSATRYFYTKLFETSGIPTRIFITSNKRVLEDGSISFWITDQDSADISDYTEIDEDALNELELENSQFKLAVKFISPTSMSILTNPCTNSACEIPTLKGFGVLIEAEDGEVTQFNI